jgi:hypothetical protein
VNRKLISFAAAVLVMIPSAAAVAQAPASAQSHPAIGPTIAASMAGIRAPSVATTSRNASAPDTHMGAGQNVALMVVGGAALIVGAVIGGAGGVLLAIGGAIVGLYGLYNFIQ